MIDKLTTLQQSALLQLTDQQVHEVFDDVIKALERHNEYRVARPLVQIEQAMRVLVVLTRQAIYEARFKEVIEHATRTEVRPD